MKYSELVFVQLLTMQVHPRNLDLLKDEDAVKFRDLVLRCCEATAVAVAAFRRFEKESGEWQ